MVIYTIGHSKHAMEAFLALLKQHGIETVVDVRSRPYSRFSPQFNKKRIEEALPEVGIRYLFLGDQLGGKPEEERFYDAEGYVRYDRIAESEAFRAGIERLIAEAKTQRVAIMCVEKEPEQCHRKLLITPVLVSWGIEVRHILADGTVVMEGEAEGGKRGAKGQGEMFEGSSLRLGRSPKPVRGKK